MMRFRSIAQVPAVGVLAIAAAWLGMAAWMFGTHRWGSLPAVVDGCGSPAPDVRFAPAPETTWAFIQGCRSRHGVASYAHLQLLDLIYPSLVAGLLVAVLFALTRRRRRLRWLAAIPVAASLADYVENAGAWTLIAGRDPAWALHAIQAGSWVKNVLSWVAWLAVIALALQRTSVTFRASRRVRRLP